MPGCKGRSPAAGRPKGTLHRGMQSDRAAVDPTRLLECDRELSVLGGSSTAHLCNHHSQLYLISCQVLMLHTGLTWEHPCARRFLQRQHAFLALLVRAPGRPNVTLLSLPPSVVPFPLWQTRRGGSDGPTEPQQVHFSRRESHPPAEAEPVSASEMSLLRSHGSPVLLHSRD